MIGISLNAGEYFEKHKGETCLIVGIGPNLTLTPPEWFNYPSFSVNTIFKQTAWEPTYFVGVDQRLWDENTDAIMARFPNVPKFVPSPDHDYLDGPNLVRFKHFKSSGHYIGGWLPTHKDALTTRGITYQRVMGAVFQIAYYMGFERMLIIGFHHEPETPREHFWGTDTGAIVNQPLAHWFDEYRHWANLGKAEVLNISENTFVPDHIIKRDDWRKWANNDNC